MTVQQPNIIRLDDYTPPAFLVDELFLHFELMPSHTVVQSVMKCRRNPVAGDGQSALVLNGEKMQLNRVQMDGKILAETAYTVDDECLTIHEAPEQFILEIEVTIKPHENEALTGLYQSRGNYCTQCESHGFRRITYFFDRPDVMTTFTTTISADKDRYPVLLSNGNLVEERELEGNRRWVKWHDPSFKPSYLFALVAGDYECLQDTFTTMSGREVALQIYVEKGNLDQSAYAMQSLKNAMRWDEQSFGREYDLDIYMIVAVSDFNMGAMENKGLNIFNDKYILARPDTATDEDYVNIESVIGHEYFHNWSGNRVTVRDWFQITLKEGLTIFRDQSFTADMTSKAVKRIKDVDVIRNVQFAQDAGPMAHSIRPREYIEINNFYTVTVYNKGSEVIRMMQTLLGQEAFRQAMDTYFSRFDGKAVTTEDFVDVMEEMYGQDLSQFRLWYEQAGTPELDIRGEYDEAAQTFTLQVKQSCPATPGQSDKRPFHIPLRVGLIDAEGNDMPLIVQGRMETNGVTSTVLSLTEPEQTFVFEQVSEDPLPSILRNFSAPVKYHYPYSDEDLIFLMKHDSDGFNQWDAAQRLGVQLILDSVAAYRKGEALSVPEAYIEAFGSVLANRELDQYFKAHMLTLPSPSYVLEMMPVGDVEAIYSARDFIKDTLAEQLRDSMLEVINETQLGAYSFNADEMGARKLKNLCYWYLCHAEDAAILDDVYAYLESADNLTDIMGAMAALNNIDCPQREKALQLFYERYRGRHLVLDKWFSLQAMTTLPSALHDVKALMQHPDFDQKNPNKVRSLVGGFGAGNLLRFHEADGSGYQFLADQVTQVDRFNPQVAARLIEPLIRWKKFDSERQSLMKAELKRVGQQAALSKDIYEIVTRSLSE